MEKTKNGKYIGVVIVLCIAFFVILNRSDSEDEQPVATENIIGCYIATIDKDVYTLSIQSQDGEDFIGTLQFKNFQKDSSSGSYTGTYVNQIASGTYSFQSEGMDSVVNTSFKKVGNDFIRGVEEEGGTMVYNPTVPTSLFKKGECLTD